MRSEFVWESWLNDGQNKDVGKNQVVRTNHKLWKDIVWLIDKSFLSRITIQNESVI